MSRNKMSVFDFILAEVAIVRMMVLSINRGADLC